MGALESGNAFLQSLLAKIPEDKRAAAADAFAAAQDAVTELGAGVLRQQDYSRAMDQTRADAERARQVYEQNRQWYEENQAALAAAAEREAELERLRAAGPAPAPTPTPTPAPSPTPPGVLTIEAAQDMVRELLGMTVVMPTLLAQHHQRFGEWLTKDMAAKLVTDAQTAGRSVEAQYAITFGEKLAAKAEADRQAEVARFKQEGVQEYLRANPSMPYPVRPTGSSPLDALKTPVDPASLSPDALAAEYNALAASKAGAAV